MAQDATNSKWLIPAELLVMAVVTTTTIWLFPLVEAAKMSLALLVAYTIPRWVYAQADHSTQSGHWVLLLSASWLSAIAIPFLYQCTVLSGASFAMPHMAGDASNYYDWALANYDGSAVEPVVTFWGYSLGIIGLWHLLGVDVIWPVAANIMATLLTIVLTGHLTAHLCSARKSFVATIAMMMIAVQGYFMSQGAQMLKEPWIYLSITLVALSLMPDTTKDSRSHHGKQMLLYALGCFILAAVRAKYINFMFIGIVMLLLAGNMRQWRHYATLLLITITCWWLGMAMTDHYTVVQQMNNVTGKHGMSAMFSPDGVYQQLMGDYFHYSLWQKLTHLPLACSVQWIIPFPWLPQNESEAWLNIVPRLRVGWYALSGLVIYYYLFRSWRRGPQWAAWAWFPLVCFTGIAYMTSGTVSRYILPFQPWWMALAASVLPSCIANRSFKVFILVYATVLIATLAVCFWLTHT